MILENKSISEKSKTEEARRFNWKNGTVVVIGLSGLILLLAGASTLFSDRPSIVDASPSPFSTRRVERLLRRHGPRQRTPNELYRFSLNQTDINAITELGNSMFEDANAAVFLVDDSLLVRSSIRVAKFPRFRYLNIDIEGRLWVVDGNPRLELDGIRIGSHLFPAFILTPLARELSARLSSQLGYGRIFSSVRAFEVTDSRIFVAYRRNSGLDPLYSMLSGTKHRLTDAEKVVVEGCLLASTRLFESRSASVNTFDTLVRNSFNCTADPNHRLTFVQRNRAGLMVLGAYFGHPPVVGGINPGKRLKSEYELASTDREALHIHGRHDWARHFTVSSVLTALMGRTLADSLGENKEVNDVSTSGFSFGDLMADRAGVAFAKRLLRDEATARLYHKRIAERFVAVEYFPSPGSLPENLTGREFERRFGRVGSPEYREMVRGIDTRIALSSAYRTLLPTQP
ncbi:MAG: hypothetical protein GY866_03285 [Proteobacteria bacterium]|nr:hypothetical protein [Pseudomonadota bacterium]